MFTSGLFETPFRWIGKAVLGFDYDYSVSGYGSGDNTFAYISLFVNFIVAILITAVWSILQPHKKEYNKVFYWLLVTLRIFLILAMLVYGFVKVFQIQFQPASFDKLLQPLGEFSPMGLAWQYMGYSKGFGLFAGLMEIIGSILLFWRRTSTIGAFIVMGVMTQVAMMNLMFDIPVKIFSLHLVFMAGIIFLTDIKRFINVFIRNESAEAVDFYNPIISKKFHKTVATIKKIMVPILLIAGTILSYLGNLNISDVNHRPALYGIWETQLFIKNSDTIPPLVTDNYRWRYLLVERNKRAIVKTMTNQIERYEFDTDTVKKKISVFDLNKADDSLNVSYNLITNNQLELSGMIDGDSLYISFKKKDLEDFTLLSRGFRWINERPYNR